jgi:ParB-like chromosome segregation protein Spo0J
MELTPELVPLGKLRPHPRNYRAHPEDQIEHLAESIRANGLYRNIVAAKDGTILAGHGVVLAATALGMASVPVVRLPIDPDSPQALKVLTGDNEIEHLAEQDDRLLTELLKEISQVDTAGLLGTGYDAAMLANLEFVKRTGIEIDKREAVVWSTRWPFTEREDLASLQFAG